MGRSAGLAPVLAALLLAAPVLARAAQSTPAADAPPVERPAATGSEPATAAPAALGPCAAGERVGRGLREPLCGRIDRPLDPTRPDGARIDVHFLVWPALAGRKLPDPVFLLAGGPGQSAIEVSSQLGPFFARLNVRRDIVFVDQRGTGRSAPLDCHDDLDELGVFALEVERQVLAMRACRQRLQRLPHGDLRQYTTTLAMHDLDAVRAALGAERINLIGSSYGSRGVLEYQRLYPERVRRYIADGVAPADMGLPASFSPDSQASLDRLLAACGADAACSERYPQLDSDWSHLMAVLPREVSLEGPAERRAQPLLVTREMVLAATRAPLYAPALAPMLANAIHAAALGRFEPFAELGGWARERRGHTVLYTGAHFSVVCAEDMPRVAEAPESPGRDFGRTQLDLYRRVCDEWPRAAVAPGFYRSAATPVAALLLSGGLDPVTPPRHGERVAQALGVMARHVEIPNAGHGVLGLPCMREVATAFLHAPEDELALRVDMACAYLPRPFAWRRLGPAEPPAGSRPGAADARP